MEEGIHVRTASAATYGSTGGDDIDGICTITVVRSDTVAAISGAFVMIGLKAGEPFAGNFGLTNASGVITFDSSVLKALKPSPPVLMITGFSLLSM